MGDQSPFIDDEEGTGLMSEKDTNKDYSKEKFCVRHWKVIFAATGVILLITLGVMIGAVFNSSDSSNGILRGSRSSTFRYSKIRLPGDILPIKYRIYLHPNLTTFHYTGSVNVLVKAKNDFVNEILLHSKGLTINNISMFEVEKSSNKDVLNDPEKYGDEFEFDDFVSEERKLEMLMIRLKKGDTLDSTKDYVVQILFNGTISKDLDGFYRSSYKENNNTKYLATTHFEATAARKAFPCFDEPAMKAKFNIIIVKEKYHTALSNMPVVRKIDRGSLDEVHFQESVQMSTYLVAFVVCDYAKLSKTTKRGTTVSVWAPKEQINQAKFAIEVAPKVLEYYEKFFNVPFPLPKQDLIAIPDFAAGAMENWGLITYRLTSILYDEKESSSSNKQWVAVVIAHELAHQWFGNLVTMKWWNDLWLNEGFAAFVEFIGANHTDPSWQMMDQFIVDDVQSSMVLDSHLNSHSISVEVKDPSQINEIFDTISYDKGASIIRMMKHFLTSDVFHTGLQNYLQKYQFSNAESDDLWSCLTNASMAAGGDIKVKTIMDTWTRQMGYPVITITKEGNKGIAKQSHFIVDKIDKASKNSDSPFGYKWEVPLTFYTQHHAFKKLEWLHPNDKNFTFDWSDKDGWLKMNIDQIGFYRVNYNSENWDALSTQLKKNHKALSVADRSNLIDDAFELAKANEMDQVKALEMTAYLKTEKEYVPWITALSSLSYIGAMLQGNDKYPDAYADYEKYMVNQVKDLARELDWKDEGTHLSKYLRGSILRTAVNHGDYVAINEGKKLFNKWKNREIESIPPNLRSAVYLAAIKYGSQVEWDFMRKKFKETKFPSEERKIMFALADSRNPAILQKYLNETMDNDVIRSQDTCSVIEHISGNPAGRKMAYEFVTKNWNKLYKRYGTGTFDMSRLIKAVFGSFKTKGGLKKVQKFISSHEMGSGELASKQAIAAVKNHIAWIDENGGKVSKWLKQQLKKTFTRQIAM